MNRTGISWCNYTLNPIRKKNRSKSGKVAHGCNKVSPACKNCYSELMNMTQYPIGDGKPYKNITYDDMMLDYKVLSRLQTNIKSKKSVFLCSMTDWSATSEFVHMEWAIGIIEACRQSKYTCYLLTKRAECLPEILRLWQIKHRVAEWPVNIWIGFTAENQKYFNKRWEHFIKADGVLDRFSDANIFVSYEPALGGLVLPQSFLKPTYKHTRPDHCSRHANYDMWCHDCRYIVMHGHFEKPIKNRWVIAGGESGNKA